MKMLLGRLLPLLTSFIFSSFSGLAVILLLIWFGGRFVGLTSVSARLMVMGVVIACYCLWLLIMYFLVRRKGAKLSKGLSGDADNGLQEKLDDVIKALKTSDLGRRYRGKGALYALPWYMIIGPSAAGKSTFFSRSGLTFPLKDDQKYHLSGIGGTRDCDWWFSDQAVLIDTAGRYSLEEDSEEWLTFLKLLKQNRPNVPVNGVILAFPLDELLTVEAEQLKKHVTHIRNRLHEISNVLGLMVPINIVITKCDLLKGFEAFFDDLSEQEVSQPWGVYLLDETEDKNVNAVEVLQNRIQGLFQRLLEQRNQKIGLAKTAEQKSDIFQFPNQFSGASEKLIDFVSLLFKESPYHERPWFSGVYFTSSLQEGMVYERSGNVLKDAFAKVKREVLNAGNSSRSYFISQFFTDVVFPLKNAVRGNRKRQRFNIIAKTFSLITLSAVVIGLALTLTGTFTANKLLLNNYQDEAGDLVRKFDSQDTSDLERLDALRDLHRHYLSLDDISTYSPLNLLNSQDLVGTHGEPMRELLVSAVGSYMHTQVVPYLHNQLQGFHQQWPLLSVVAQNKKRSEYYESLKYYLMMTSHQAKISREDLSFYLSRLWLKSYEDDQIFYTYSEELETLSQMVDMYLEYFFFKLDENSLNPWYFDAVDIQNVQANLVTSPSADTLYRALVDSAQGRFETVSLKSLVGSEHSRTLISNYSFSGVYSRKAWETYVSSGIKELTVKASEGDWVLGQARAVEDEEQNKRFQDKLEIEIRQQYFKDYSHHWRSFLGSVAIQDHDDLGANLKAIKALSGDTGPMAKLFEGLSENVKLHEAVVGSAAGNVLDKLTEGDEKAPIPVIPIVPLFADAAEDLIKLVKDEDDTGAADIVESYIVELALLTQELEVMSTSANRDELAKQYAAELLSGNPDGKQLFTSWINIQNILTTVDASERKLIASVMESPILASWSSMIVASQRAVQRSWEEKVYSSYQNSLRGRFPFNSQGSDASVVDFDAMMTPQSGALWRFVASELDPFVQKSGSGIKSRKWLGKGLSFDTRSLNSIGGAERLSQSLYGDDQSATFTYWVYPVPVPGLSESSITVGSSNYRYRNEPQEWREFSWALNDSYDARIEAKSNGSTAYGDVRFEGPWALLRLIDKAVIDHVRGTEFSLSWSLPTGSSKVLSTRFHFRADREGSVLNKGIVGRVSIPQFLFRS